MSEQHRKDEPTRAYHEWPGNARRDRDRNAGNWRPAAPAGKAAPFWHPVETADRFQPAPVRFQEQWCLCPKSGRTGVIRPCVLARSVGPGPWAGLGDQRPALMRYKDQKHTERTAFHGPPQHPRRGKERGAFRLTAERRIHCRRDACPGSGVTASQHLCVVTSSELWVV